MVLQIQFACQLDINIRIINSNPPISKFPTSPEITSTVPRGSIGEVEYQVAAISVQFLASSCNIGGPYNLWNAPHEISKSVLTVGNQPPNSPQLLPQICFPSWFQRGVLMIPFVSISSNDVQITSNQRHNLETKLVRVVYNLNYSSCHNTSAALKVG